MACDGCDAGLTRADYDRDRVLYTSLRSVVEEAEFDVLHAGEFCADCSENVLKLTDYVDGFDVTGDTLDPATLSESEHCGRCARSDVPVAGAFSYLWSGPEDREFVYPLCEECIEEMNGEIRRF